MATTTSLDFSVIRGDKFDKPFLVTLDQSRTLDGTEDWALTARASVTSTPVFTMTKSNGQIAIETVEGQANQPVAKFTPSVFSDLSVTDDDLPLKYDLQMTKDGNVETIIPKRTSDGDIEKGTLTVVMDMTR